MRGAGGLTRPVPGRLSGGIPRPNGAPLAPGRPAGWTVEQMRGTSPERPAILYLVYWGALEPLGQALVLPSVRRLAQLGARVTLVTFDKAEDLCQREQVEAI